MIKMTDTDLNYTTMTDVNIQGISEYYRKIVSVFNADSDCDRSGMSGIFGVL